jgi:transcription initiation factor TFIIIB Brf1 subunit/transcription initiation factor TFIIB
MNFKNFFEIPNTTGGRCPSCRSNDTTMVTQENEKTAHVCRDCGRSWNWAGKDKKILVYGPEFNPKHKNTTQKPPTLIHPKTVAGKISLFDGAFEGTTAGNEQDTYNEWYSTLEKEAEEETEGLSPVKEPGSPVSNGMAGSMVPAMFRNKKDKAKLKEEPLKPLVRRVIWDKPEESKA